MAGEGLFQNQRAPWLTTTPTAAGSVTHPPDSGDVRISIDPTTFVMRIHDSSTGDWPLAARSKFDATTAPGVSNDDSEGYSPGSKWVDVTNDEIYECADASTGAAVWKNTSAGGSGGAMTMTEEKVAPSGGSASMDFTSIAGTARHLEFVVSCISEKVATFDMLRMQFNGDTGANYSEDRMTGFSTTEQTVATSGATSIQVANCGGTTATANMFSMVRVRLPFYADTNMDMLCSITGGEIYASGAAGSRANVNTAGYWNNSAAITSVKFFFAANDIAEFSKIAMYLVS